MYSNSLSFLVGSAQDKLANDIKRADKTSAFRNSNSKDIAFKSISKESFEDRFNLTYLRWSIKISLFLIFSTMFSFGIYKIVLYKNVCCSSGTNTTINGTILLRNKLYNAKFPWLNQNTPIIYEIETVTFYDGNNDGIGDLAGISLKLDYIQKSLFVNCILIKNIQNGFSFKYYNLQLSKIEGIDEKIGNFDDLKYLISEARRRSIKVNIIF
jgi:hypothetical protein